MCICAVLLPDLLFFSVKLLAVTLSFFPEGAEEQEDTEQLWMRVNSYSPDVWSEVKAKSVWSSPDFGGSCLEGNFI